MARWLHGVLARRRAAQIGAVAGVLAPLLVVSVLVALTIDQLSFLRSSGWSPVRRTAVGWPSLLALGPHGWVQQAAFVVAALLGLAFAASLFGRDRRARREAGLARLPVGRSAR